MDIDAILRQHHEIAKYKPMLEEMYAQWTEHKAAKAAHLAEEQDWAEREAAEQAVRTAEAAQAETDRFAAEQKAAIDEKAAADAAAASTAA